MTSFISAPIIPVPVHKLFKNACLNFTCFFFFIFFLQFIITFG